MNKLYPLDLTHNTDKLKSLIAKNPDLPIVVLVGDEANPGDYSAMFCEDVKFDIGEILDAEVPYRSDYVATDRVEFEECLAEWLWDKMGGELEETEPDEDIFDNALRTELAKYEPYWKKVIVIFAVR